MRDPFALNLPGHFERRRFVAAWYCFHFRAIAAEDGVSVAARRLRKYGVPIEVALRVLGIAPSIPHSIAALGRDRAEQGARHALALSAQPGRRPGATGSSS
jgi:hypothetical protein